MRIRIFSTVLIIGIMCSIASAQETTETPQTSSETETAEMTIIADDSGGSAPMIFATRSTSVDGGAPQFMRLVGDSGGAFGNFSLSTSGMAGAPDPYSMLSDPSVQKDLELVGEQRDKVMQMQEEFSKQLSDKIGDLSKSGGINPDRFKGVGELIKKIREEQRSQIDQVLLPHQIERLQQVALQKHMKSAGTAGALSSDKLAQELGISDEQKARLKKRSQEIKEEMNKKMEEMRAKAKQDLLQELTSEQRQKLKDLTGEKFESKRSDWNEQLNSRIQRRIRSTPAQDKD